MAIVNFVSCRKSQTVGGLNGVINYCCHKSKTDYQGRQLISGVNCVPQFALQEFMNTKRLHKNTDGRMYYDRFTDAEKKEFLNCFIERVDIFPQTLSSGRILRHIKFRFPIFFDGQEVLEIGWDNETTLESIVCLVRN